MQCDVGAATGVGGIGKTQLATEFVHRYGRYFAGGVFWLSFADAVAVSQEVAACGDVGHLNLHPDFADLALNEQVKLVRAAWHSPLPRLLVFDNCEDEALLQQWRPTYGGCRVLVTSRRTEWSVELAIRSLLLNVLQRSEGIALLCKYRPDLSPDDSALDAIAAELGDLPLALHLAGSYLARYRRVVSPGEYLAQLRSPPLLAHESLKGAGHSPTGHVQHVKRTFALSFKHLQSARPIDALAQSLLARAACFASGTPIPHELLLSTLNLSKTPILYVEDALIRLFELGLLTVINNNALQMHHLLALFTKDQVDDPMAQHAVEQTMLKLATEANEQNVLAPVLPVQTHLRHVTDVALQRYDASASDLCEALARHLWLLSEYVEAQVYAERALMIRQEVERPDPLRIAACFNLLGLIYQGQGMFADARSAFERALAMWEQQLGADHPRAAAEHDNLGHLLMTTGEYAAARPHLERALVLQQKLSGLESDQTARAMHHLGYFLSLQGEYESAEKLLTQALAIRENVLPRHHWRTAQNLNELGEVLMFLGRNEEALQVHQRALVMREIVFGPKHHDIAESWCNIGRVLHAKGELEQARDYFERALLLHIETLGENHFETAFIQAQMGNTLHALGELDQAQALLEQALQLQEQNYGIHHPFTARTLRFLASLRLSMNDPVTAQDYIRRSLTALQTTFGPNHPETSEVLIVLASVLAHGDDVEGAQSALNSAIMICNHRLGSEHPTTRAIHAHLAALNR